MVIRIGTRKSPLAMYQADFVAKRLLEVDSLVKCELVGIDSRGDLDQSESLFNVGGQGIFVNAIRQALIEKRVDIVVHSAKDIPSGSADRIVTAAFPIRSDVRDVLIGKKLSELEPGDIVRTGSARRMIQMSRNVAGLQFEELRGNIATRLSKVPPNGSILVAKAALDRLNIVPSNAEILSTEVMLPQVGQGVIAVETEVDNGMLFEFVNQINDSEVANLMTIERGFLNAIGSDCTSPVGGLASYEKSLEEFQFEAMLGNLKTNGIVRKRFVLAESGNLNSFGSFCAESLIESAKLSGLTEVD